MKTINYYPAITGNGKSTEALTKIAKEHFKRFILAVPSIELSFEHAKKLGEMSTCQDIQIINSESAPRFSTGSVVSNIERVIINQNARVIIITHESLKRLFSHVQNLSIFKQYSLIIDEKIDFYQSHTLTLNEWSYDVLDDVVEFEPFKDDYKMTIKKDRINEFKSISEGILEDAFIEEGINIFGLITMLVSTNHDVYVSASDYEKYMRRSELGTKRIYPLSMLKVDCINSFRSIDILSSLFDQTVSYKIFQNLGFEMVRQTLKNERSAHTLNAKLNVHYVTDHNWSTSLRTKEVGGKSILEHVWDHYTSKIDGEFIYHVNVDSRGFLSNPRGHLLTALHGLNNYRHIKDAVFLSSLNSADEYKSLAMFGIERSDIDHERNVLECYQFVSRTAVRDDANTDEVNLYVPDLRCASFLKGLFPQAHVEMDEVEPIQKQKNKKAPMSGADRKFLCKFRKAIAEGKEPKQKAKDRYDRLMARN